MIDAPRLSAARASELLERGELSAESLVRACLERIEAREPLLHAWAHLDPDAALRQARARDAEPRRSAVHGLPVGIKDNMDTSDMPTGYGAGVHAGHRPALDAAIVAQLRAAGAVILGKTVTAEFAAYAAGPTRNPRDPARTPGISSMGSAAAVADGMVPFATGTQTAGSIIRPASFCGAVGYKPSFGLFSRSGVRPLADSLDTVGFFVRKPADLALFSSVLTGRPGFGEPRGEPPPRIGFCRTPAWERAEPGVQAAVEAAARALAAEGAEVRDVDLPDGFAQLNEAILTVLQFEAARALAEDYRLHQHALHPLTVRLIETGRCRDAAEYASAWNLAAHCRRRAPALFETADLLICPGAECEAPPHDAPVGDSVFNRLWTLLHLPCISLPVLRGASGLPVGLQVIGPMHADDALIRRAQWIWDRLR